MRKQLAECFYCKCQIFGADFDHYADDAYFDGRTWFCEDCKDEYLEQFRINKEMEEYT